MTFSENLIHTLQPFINKYHLSVEENDSDSLSLLNDDVRITIVYNRMERSNTIWIGRNRKDAIGVEIDNSVLRNVFHLTFDLTDVTTSVFIDNLFLFFSSAGRTLFNGNTKKLQELIRYNELRNQNYTSQLITKQYLQRADQAWANEDFHSFIENLEKIDKLELPQSYYLKYKMALNKIKR